MKRWSKIGLSALCLVSFSVANFSQSSLNWTREVSAENAKAEIWTTYNSYTVLQDPDSMTGKYVSSPLKQAVDEANPLRVDMCQGESEGAQIILTAKEDISSYDLTVSDLTRVGGEEKIPSSDIDVYKQHYLDSVGDSSALEERIKENVPTGEMWPDILIPMDAVKKVGENTVKAGDNQGISIEIEARSGDETDEGNYTPAGTYRGEVTLTLENEETILPLIVTVRAVDLTENHYISTCASSGLSGSNRKTYETLMEDWHTMCQYAPEASSSPERMVEEVSRYWDNPAFTNYEITCYDEYRFYKNVFALAQASDEEHNYLSKALVYMQGQDEPSNAKDAGNYAMKYVNQKKRVINQLESMHPGAENAVLRALLKTTIEAIPMYFAHGNWHKTMLASDFDVDGYLERGEKLPYTFCFSTATCMFGEEVYEEHKNVTSQPMFTYVNGTYPFTGYASLNYGSGFRMLGWLSAEMDIAGKLFWDSDMVRHMVPGINNYVSRAYYEDAIAFGTLGGNGYLIVSAKKYGEPDEWLPTIRLRNFRDAAEDYDLMYELEELYASKLNRYGISSMNFDGWMEWIYNKGFDCAFYVPDNGSAVSEMKTIAMDLYELANSPYNVLLSGVEIEGKTATATFYAEADSVTANGNSLTKVGGKYVYSWDLNESEKISLTFSKAGEETATLTADVFDFGTLKDGLQKMTAENVSNYATSSLPGYNETKVPAGTVTFENGLFKADIPRAVVGENGLTNIDLMDYTPWFTLNADLFGVEDLREIYYVNMKIRIVLKGAPVDDKGKSSDKIVMTVGALGMSDMLLGTNGTEINSFVFDERHKVAGEEYVYERNLSFLVEHVSTGKVAGIGFMLKSFHGNLYTMGATIEVSNLWYSDYPFGEK